LDTSEPGSTSSAQVVGHQHVRLFDELRSRHPVSAEQDVGRDRWCRHRVDQQRFQREVSGELLVRDLGVDAGPARVCSASRVSKPARTACRTSVAGFRRRSPLPLT